MQGGVNDHSRPLFDEDVVLFSFHMNVLEQIVDIFVWFLLNIVTAAVVYLVAFTYMVTVGSTERTANTDLNV